MTEEIPRYMLVVRFSCDRLPLYGEKGDKVEHALGHLNHGDITRVSIYEDTKP